ncbi:MAG: HpaII family restriction endonuclease [Sulfurovum sp.]|nr:HpaII family restriction endonuclease [Sulfurovum sp.]
MGFNKGEWSELYTFLSLLVEPSLAIVDENLQVINQNTFEIQEIYVANKSIYKIDENNILKISHNSVKKTYKKEYLSTQKTLLLHKIQTHKKAKGSFDIIEINPLIDDLLDGNKLKGSSKKKGDLEALVLDNNRQNSIKLNYNIKSNLGAKATLLNASSHTNFIYEISNIDDEIMHKNNAISGRKKLLDRCVFLEEHNASMKFVKVQSDTFSYNLKMIDSNLDRLLADMLYLSYQENEKDIKKLISMSIKDKDEYDFYQKKIGDFASAVTFGIMSSKKWNGKNEVNGGIILVNKAGEVYLLDLIYFKSIVDKYLINNIKLESPSSTRYKMFEIYKEDEKILF